MNSVSRFVSIAAFAAAMLAGTANVYADVHNPPPKCGFSHWPSCNPGPGTTLPTCKGAHKGPNGVMIQCQ